jgi:hypothetical protein
VAPFTTISPIARIVRRRGQPGAGRPAPSSASDCHAMDRPGQCAGRAA